MRGDIIACGALQYVVLSSRGARRSVISELQRLECVVVQESEVDAGLSARLLRSTQKRGGNRTYTLSEPRHEPDEEIAANSFRLSAYSLICRFHSNDEHG